MSRPERVPARTHSLAPRNILLFGIACLAGIATQFGSATATGFTECPQVVFHAREVARSPSPVAAWQSDYNPRNEVDFLSYSIFPTLDDDRYFRPALVRIDDDLHLNATTENP